MPSYDTTRKLPEVESGGEADQMVAVVAACALIAFADGSLAESERRRVFVIFQTDPAFAAFSHSDVEAEFSRHKQAFEEDPATARREAYVTIKSLRLTDAKAQLILNACQQVLEADGVAHPLELAEIDELRTVLQSCLSK